MDLLEFNGRLGTGRDTKKVKFLTDCGASHVYMAAKLSCHWPHLECTLPEKSVTLPDGSEMKSNKGITIPYKIGSFEATLTARVLDLKGYDVILGMDWLREHNPQINWFTGDTIIDQQVSSNSEVAPRQHLLRPKNTISDLLYNDFAAYEEVERLAALNSIPIEQAERRMFKKDYPGVLWMIRPAQDDEKPPPESDPNLLAMSDLDELDLSKVPKELHATLRKHAVVFRRDLPEHLAQPRAFDHSIDTEDAKPINLPAYPLSHAVYDFQRKQIQELLDKGLIRTSASEWGSPVLFVPKPPDPKKPGETQWRMCVDYRALNSVTKKNTYPLPRIRECLDAFGNAQYFSKIDLTSGFWQLRVASEDVPKTAFNTRQGKFEFLVMPMGLTNAPATFQTMMNSILGDRLFQYVLVYLDDIVVFSDTLEDHVRHLDEVLQLLSSNELYAKPHKCKIGASEIEFCGHIISHGSSRPTRDKAEAIASWPVPKNVHEVRQFLGLVGFYRQYIPGHAKLFAPLQELLKELDASLRANKFRQISWTASCQVSFEKLKELIISQPCLSTWDESLPVLIETDASEWATGYVLYQEKDRKMHPIAFGGRKLSGAELNYPVHEKELLAIKNALREWDHYINGKRTVILTDHKSLQYLTSSRNQSKRLARWVDEFQQYDLDIRYRKGSEAIVPDAISRRPDFIGKGPANVAWIAALHGQSEDDFIDALLSRLHNKDATIPIRLHNVITPQFTCQFFLDADGSLRKKLQGFSDKNTDHLITHTVPFIEKTFRYDLVKSIHNQYGHFGYPGLLGPLELKGWWPEIDKDVRQYALACKECQLAQRSKAKQRNETQFHRVRHRQPFEEWAIDLIGILPTTNNGNRWIITAIDYATCWPVAEALQDAEATTVADFIYRRIYADYGPPRILLSDNGKNFLSKVVSHFLGLLRTRHRLTTPYHPRANGKVENLNGTLGEILTKMCMNQLVTTWDLYIEAAVWATRIRKHATTGFSPYYLVYGRHPPMPEDVGTAGESGENAPDKETDLDALLARIAEVRTARSLATRQLLDRAVQAGLQDPLKFKGAPFFSVGDWVLLRNETHTKLQARWLGPYRIFKRHPLGTYALETPTKPKRILEKLVHGDRLTKTICHSVQDFWIKYERNPRLQTAGVEKHDADIEEILETAPDPPRSYEDLREISATEWRRLFKERGYGNGKVGEGKDGQPLVVQTKQKKKKQARKPRQQIVPRRPRTVPHPEEDSDAVEEIADANTVRITPELTPPGDPTTDTSPQEPQARRLIVKLPLPRTQPEPEHIGMEIDEDFPPHRTPTPMELAPPQDTLSSDQQMPAAAQNEDIVMEEAGGRPRRARRVDYNALNSGNY
jgi:transposase InsO family protein